MLNNYIYKILAVALFLLAFVFMPGKSLIFNSLVYFSKAVVSVVLMYSAAYLWRK